MSALSYTDVLVCLQLPACTVVSYPEENLRASLTLPLSVNGV